MVDKFHFDAFTIGLTATPNKQAFGFFDQNLVMEYGHEQAVVDGVNVDFDVYRIRTDTSEPGSTIDAGLWTQFATARRAADAKSLSTTSCRTRRPSSTGRSSRATEALLDRVVCEYSRARGGFLTVGRFDQQASAEAAAPSAPPLQRLRVALLSYRSMPHCGGQGVYVRNLSRELVALGHEVEVFSGQPYPELEDGVTLTQVPSLDLYREPGPFRTPHWREYRDAIDLLEVGTMWTGGFPEPLTFSIRVARLLDRRLNEFDVVHDNQSLGYGLLSLARRGIALVATIHHPITVDRRLELQAAPSRLRRVSLRRWYGFHRMQARVAQRISPILTVSGASAADIARDFGIAGSALRIVPNGVDATLFRPRLEARVPGRIVAVSNADSPLKGMRVLVEAMASLCNEHEVELVVAGKPPADGPVAEAIGALGLADRVRFANGLPDQTLARLIASAEVAVVPSLYEGFSLPAIEAMACSTPVVTTRGGALPEVVGDDGACGVLVAPGDAQELAAAIGALLGDPRRRAQMGEAGRRRVRERYTWRTVAAATVDCYQEAIMAAARDSASPVSDAVVNQPPPTPIAERSPSC